MSMPVETLHLKRKFVEIKCHSIYTLIDRYFGGIHQIKVSSEEERQGSSHSGPTIVLQRSDFCIVENLSR